MKHVTIRNAFAARTEDEIAAARRRLEALWAAREADFGFEDAGGEEDGPVIDVPVAPEIIDMPLEKLPGREEAEKLLERSRALLPKIHPDDVEEAVAIHERIEAAIQARNAADLEKAAADLRELLFFLEGK